MLDGGKYKGIIISIALFVLLDASVLLMNFYISFQIAQDAVDVNVSGRQRMLSQRIVKSLLDIKLVTSNQGDASKSLSELNKTIELFDSTLTGFETGGAATGADGAPVVLTKVDAGKGRQAISEARVIWDPFYEKLKLLFVSDVKSNPLLFNKRVDDAVNFGKENNLSLLALMNQLTVDLENVATSKAKRLRWIQTIGITLAVINFFIILSHFIRQLRESDESISIARRETSEILGTVNQGLFLLDNKLTIGGQYSAEMKTIFGRDDIAGKPFLRFIKDIVTEKDLNNAGSYIKLLFDRSKKQRLLGDLNPLKKVSVQISNNDGTFENKFLKFSFSRVLMDASIEHILVTVMDITQQVKLEMKLEQERNRNEQQLDMLSNLISANRDMLPMFIENTFAAFNKINDILKMQVSGQSRYLDKLNLIYNLIHNVKGEASALNLSSFVDLAHEFENSMEVMKQQPQIKGNDFLGLAVLLNQMISHAEIVDDLCNKVLSGKVLIAHEGVEQAVSNTNMDWQHLQDLADSVAENQDKQVEVVFSGLNDYSLPKDFVQTINNISIQLIRNAVVHGIETVTDRLEAQKPESGLINIRLGKRKSGDFQYTFDDDGNGIDLNALRQSAIEKQIITEQVAEQMDRKELISLIFMPDVSTKDVVDHDAGRGVGMHAVMSEIKRLGAKIQIKTRRGNGCVFNIIFPENYSVNQEVA